MANYQSIQNVNNFESLIEYLRDELDWDFQAEDIEDLTFDYEPAELGLDEATAAKIDGIKQLRPLTNNQTWGIFYIDFEPKNLPIVALRRILSKLVIKRRTSANQSERAVWQMHDLLFMSSYGENQKRTMSFAHFADNTGFGDLPTLKTINWNNLDTASHLRHADETLKTKLRFPDDPNDAEAWREQWASAFTQKHGEVVRTSKQLAVRLAKLADNIRTQANAILILENEKGSLRGLHSAFKEALIHDLSYDDFADMYAQTISYGLLAARISRTEGLVADNLADMIVQVANPFLKEQLQKFIVVGGRGKLIDFDELGINDVVEMLRKADMEAVLRDFGDRNPNEDPAILFYEFFLKEYDPEKRMKRGVFYTPRPVVSFIVRSVHEILQKEFGLADGLADTTTWGEMKRRGKDLEIPAGVKETAPFVQILDPATGTGTFLVEVINVIYETLLAKWQREGKSKDEQIEAWNDYVPKNLLPRLYGFELMMAPYSIAHMKIGLKLSETGYRFLSSERAQIYLTNTLEEPKDFSDYFATMSPALAHEAEAANRVKRHTPITVVVGNPPYSVMSSNLSEEMKKTIEPYRFVDGEPIRERSMLRLEMHLQDDYVKFVRYSQKRIDDTGLGVMGLISNNGYFDNLTLRGMRNSLLKSFPSFFVLNLHGSVLREDKETRRANDQNVFDIEQGVGISYGVKLNGNKSEIRHTDLIGARESKYEFLQKHSIFSVQSQKLNPKAFNYFLAVHDVSFEDEYLAYSALSDVFKDSISGIVTAHDKLVIDFEDEVLKDKTRILRDRTISDDEARNIVLVNDNAGWKLSKARQALNATPDSDDWYKDISYRPFDTRRINYHPALVWCDRQRVMRNMLNHKNIGLSLCRQLASPPFQHVLVTRNLQDDCYVSNRTRERSYLYPLYLYPTERDKFFVSNISAPPRNRRANFSDEFIEEFSNKLGLEFKDEGGRMKDEKESGSSFIPHPSSLTFSPEDVFHYAYAVFHSPTYRARYAEFLKIDFPRLPLTTDRELFRKLGVLGANLVRLHLLEGMDAPADWELSEPPALAGGSTADKRAFQSTANPPANAGGSDKTVAAGFPKKELFEIDQSGKGKVYINKTTRFDGVPEPVWNFHIGGYQVCHKWLKDRKDRELSEEDINHYGKIVVALGETIRLMAEIDETIEEHGGFPLVGSQS